MKEKKNAEAIIAFKKALEIEDNLPNVWNDRGLCFRGDGGQ